MAGDCGTCTMCCKLLAVKEIKKTSGAWCPHCAPGAGCKIYDTRPESCREFKCLWLLSRDRPDPRERMPMELRPDKCKVVVHPTTADNIVSVNVDPGFPAAWQNKLIRDLIGKWARTGVKIVVGWGTGTRKMMIYRDRNVPGKILAEEIEMSEPDEEGMQWHKHRA